MTLEELQEQLLAEKERARILEENLATTQEIAKQRETRIQELQEHNQKLFLRVTTNPTQTDDQTDDGQTVEDFISSLLGGE